MKKLLTLILILPCIGYAQYFSGEITYEVKIKPKSDTLDLKEIIEQNHGTTTSYIITAHNYKSTYYKDKKYSYSYSYDDKTQRMYDDHTDKPYITFRDSRKSNFEYYGSQIFKDSTAAILGHDCYMVMSESEYGVAKTYYSDDIKVDYANFEGHKVGNWYNKLKEVDGAIPLRTVTEFDLYFEIREAIKIEERKVKPKEFKLPQKPLAASFTALDKQIEMQPPSQQQIQCYQQKVNSVSVQRGEKTTILVSFLLEKNGKIKFIKPLEEDAEGLHKIAVDIVTNCGFQYTPGIIAEEPVDSEAYFPVVFFR
ncbi:hypothetical protein C9994_12405 [Marivirga lumbricoides]|uniref:TonB C-terminal domain-containing protein n=1 Tax=Marivirga lumbricoides TaxID=1046115 RepID=A0A2T4DJV4_9BACT|nr:hypothetical protein C9994_12405 [Marivirga lumbricoides]